MLSRFRDSLVLSVAAWLVLVAGTVAAGEMAVDRVHLHAATGTLSGGAVDGAVERGHGMDAVRVTWHLPAGDGWTGGDAGDCVHCQHTGGYVAHPAPPSTAGLEPASSAPPGPTVPCVGPTATDPPHRPPIA